MHTVPPLVLPSIAVSVTGSALDQPRSGAICRGGDVATTTQICPRRQPAGSGTASHRDGTMLCRDTAKAAHAPHTAHDAHVAQLGVPRSGASGDDIWPGGDHSRIPATLLRGPPFKQLPPPPVAAAGRGGVR